MGSLDIEEFVIFLKSKGIDLEKEYNLFKADADENADENDDEVNDDNPIISIYVDGAVSNNGKENAIGGIGIYCKELDISISKHIGNATNNFAELEAIYLGLSIVKYLKITDDVYIFSDSEYSIKSIMIWSKNWEKNGWKTKNKKQVSNKEVIQKCITKLDKLPNVTIRHVRGHTGVHGNEQADLLAKKAIG